MARGWALAGVLLWALNPLVALLEGRQVLLDTISLPWLIGVIVLASTPRQPPRSSTCSTGLCFGIAVLTKETNLIFAPALVLADLAGRAPPHPDVRPHGLRRPHRP